MSLYSKYFYAEEVDQIFSEKNIIDKMLRIEAALAQAQAESDMMALSTANIIQKFCSVEHISIEDLKNDLNNDGNIAISLIRQLTGIVNKNDSESAKFIHLGATSQDIIDTAYVLLIRDAVEWFLQEIDTIISTLRKITSEHKKTVMIGRTLMQHAKPITFGLKTSAWLEGIWRSKKRIEQLKRALKIQLAGPVGSRNEYLTENVIDKFAKALSLETAFSWHTQRDQLAEWVTTLGILSSQLGKIASDLLLLMQTEIGEISETSNANTGGSSSMPHKHNPVHCNAILANAHRIPHLVATFLGSMLQQNERSAGLWHAEWETLESVFRLTAGSLKKCATLFDSLEVNTDQMLANVNITQGLIFSENIALQLAGKMGKMEAHAFVRKICEKSQAEHRHLKDLLKDQSFSEEEIDSFFNLEIILGSTYEIIEAILQNTRTDGDSL